MSVLLGIDLGTSGVKVLAVNEDGKVLTSTNLWTNSWTIFSR